MIGKFSPVSKYFLWAVSLAGLALSAMSVLNICTSACSDVSLYTIFGLDFGWFGLLFFSALLASLGVQSRFPWSVKIFTVLVCAAAGAELRFIWLQKYVIGQWCPLCLFIAGAVYLAFAIVMFETCKAIRTGEEKMKAISRFSVVLVLMVVLGWFGAVVGVDKKAGAQQLNTFLGKPDSETVVYFVNDWFCPACRRVEPVIEKMFPKVAEVAKVSFVDIPVHPETANYTPYNLQFLVYEKAKYMQLHRALSELSKKTKTPSPDDVQSAIAPYGVKLRTMNFTDILSGIKWNESVYGTFGIRATPTVVVSNSRTGKNVKLVGENEISYGAVIRAITEVGK